jgi:aquaporin Z
MTNPSLIARLLTELIGTLFLMLIILLATGKGVGATEWIGAGQLAPFAIAFGLISLIYMGGPTSGAHYNPAVSFAVFYQGELSLSEFGWYVGAQILGAALACGLCVGLGITGGPTASAGAASASAWLFEGLFTFMLVLVILNVAVSKRAEKSQYFGLAIGLVVFVGATVAGPVSGAALNPAIGVVPSLILSGKLDHAVLYTVAPLAGAVLAALAFRIQER